ncbi:hypothetical protein CCP3SC15_40004 [Gammaproteobacteria bacterium]
MDVISAIGFWHTQIHRRCAGVVEHIGYPQCLSTLRDTLLPRLISGQLRLPEAEAILEESIV